MKNDWIACSTAYTDLKLRFDNTDPMTIRKAIIGMIMDSVLPVVCAEYSETALVYLTEEHVSKSVDPWRCHIDGDSPIFDFWHYDMAVGGGADASFSSGAFGHELSKLASDLPYRFFKNTYARDNIPAKLYQLARGVRFSVPHLDSLFSDRRWSKVWVKRAEPKPPGLKKAWLWDEVKAALTVTIAANPHLLTGNAAQIVREMEELFDVFQPLGGAPDKRDLFRYAQRIIAQGRPSIPAP